MQCSLVGGGVQNVLEPWFHMFLKLLPLIR